MPCSIGICGTNCAVNNTQLFIFQAKAIMTVAVGYGAGEMQLYSVAKFSTLSSLKNLFSRVNLRLFSCLLRVLLSIGSVFR